MDFIKENWDWITESIWKVISIATIFFAAGWGLATLFYKERIEILKEKINSKNEIPTSDAPGEFIYPETGKNGRNILANSTLSVQKGEKVSLRAIIPKNEKILIELKGPKRLHKQDGAAAWFFLTSKIRNWTTKTYEYENGGRQEFDAESGSADMEIVFQRVGKVIISVFEGDLRSNTWTKEITVRN